MTVADTHTSGYTSIPPNVAQFGRLADEAGLTIDEASQILRIGKSTVWAWAKSGRIELRRIGRTTRVTAGELRRLMAGGA